MLELTLGPNKGTTDPSLPFLKHVPHWLIWQLQPASHPGGLGEHKLSFKSGVPRKAQPRLEGLVALFHPSSPRTGIHSMAPLRAHSPLAYTPAETVPTPHHPLKQPFLSRPLVLHQATHSPICSNLAYKMLGTIPTGGDTVVEQDTRGLCPCAGNMLGVGVTHRYQPNK